MTVPTRLPAPPALRRALTLLPGLLLVLGAVMAALHHHPDEGHGHPCAICTLSHTAASVTAGAAPAAPGLRAEQVVPPPPTVPARLARALGRARSSRLLILRFTARPDARPRFLPRAAPVPRPPFPHPPAHDPPARDVSRWRSAAMTRRSSDHRHRIGHAPSRLRPGAGGVTNPDISVIGSPSRAGAPTPRIRPTTA